MADEDDDDEDTGCQCCRATHRAEWVYEGTDVCLDCFRILRALDVFLLKRLEHLRSLWSDHGGG